MATPLGYAYMSGTSLPFFALADVPASNQLRVNHPTKGVVCFELVPTTDANASKVRLFKGATRSIRKQPPTNIPSLTVVAHQDDDLGGVNPDVYNDIKAAGTTGVVIVGYLTAGDNGGGWTGYAQNREKGVQAAYAYMAGKPNTWTTGTRTINGKVVAHAQLNGTNIQHLYFRLPDSANSINGSASISLYRLWTGSITSMKAVDSAITYTKAEIITAIASLIDTNLVQAYRHSYHLGTLGDGEHYEHHAGGYFGNAGLLASTTTPPIVVAYRTDTLSETSGWVTISTEESTAKRGALAAYAPFDPGLGDWQNDPEIQADMTRVWRYVYTKPAVVIPDPTPEPTGTIVKSGLIGYWNAKQGISGATWSNLAPTTLGKYNGTITGAATTANTSVNLDGQGDYVTIGAIQAADKLTAYEVEIYMDSPFDGTYGSEVNGEWAYMPFATANSGMSAVTALAIKTDGSRVFLSNETPTAKVFPKNTLLKINYAVNVTTRQETLYVDDVQVVQAIMGGASSNLDNVRFGAAPWDGSYAFKGKIYSMKMYNRILTAAERTQNAANGKEIGLQIAASSVKALYISSHQDDDIAGFFPDMLTDMRAAGDTGTIIAIYLTAGDNFQGWASHAQNRELGIEAAYAHMAGKPNVWTKGTITLNGKAVPYAKLNGTNITHLYPRLGDSSLEGLWSGTSPTRYSVDTNTPYTKNDLITLISTVMDTYQITTVRHLYHLAPLNDPEHKDHTVGGYFGNAGVLQATTAPTTVIGYRVDTLGSTAGWVNISAEDVAIKRATTNVYAQFDTTMAGWENFPEEIQNLDKVWRYPYTVMVGVPTIASTFNTPLVNDSTSINIPYTVTDDGTANLTATYTKNGVVTTASIAKGANTWAVGLLAVGSHVLKIKVTDIENKTSEELTFNITVTATGSTPKIVTSGLVGYWNSKQGVSGTAWNNIAPATVGTANSVITGATVVANGMNFTTGSYVQMTLPTAMQTVTPFTWEMRLNLTNISDTPDVLSDGVAQSIMYIDASVVHIYLADNVEKSFTRASGAGEIYLAFTYNPTTGLGTLYANGAKVGDITYATNQRFSRDAAVRMGSYETYNPAGILDNLRFYNRTLTLAEIQQNYAVGKEIGL